MVDRKKYRNAKENRDPLSKRSEARHSHHEEDPDGSTSLSPVFFNARTVTAGRLFFPLGLSRPRRLALYPTDLE